MVSKVIKFIHVFQMLRESVSKSNSKTFLLNWSQNSRSHYVKIMKSEDYQMLIGF